MAIKKEANEKQTGEIRSVEKIKGEKKLVKIINILAQKSDEKMTRVYSAIQTISFNR